MSTHPISDENPRQHNSGEQVQKWLYDCYDSGNWFQFQRDFLFLVSSDAAIVLQSLLNLAKYRNKDGWILGTSGYFEKELNMTRSMVERVLRELKQKGFIETELKGLPALRYIRIHLQDLQRGLDEVKANRLQLHENQQTGCSEISMNKGIPTEYPNKSNKHCRVTDSAASPPRGCPDRVEDTTTFPIQIPGEDKHHPRRAIGRPKLISKTPSPESLGYAQLLYDKVAAAGKVSSKNVASVRHNWACRITDTELKYTASTVAHAFNWYMEHFEDQGRFPFPPTIECGNSFYIKFQKLLDAIERDKKANPQVTISPEAEQIAKKLVGALIWPKGSGTQLPTVVEISIDTVTQLRYRLKAKYRAIREGDKSSPRLSTEERVAYCIFDLLGQAGFIREWFEQVHRHIATWDKWNGKLLPFDPSHKDFRVFAQSWTQSKCSDPKVCDKILKELMK